MEKLSAAFREVLLALLLVLLNGWLVVRVIGLPYGPFQWAVFAQTYMSETDLPGGCSDGVDNDADGLIDCADAECRTNPACASQAPTMGPAGVALAIFVLVIVSFFGLRPRSAKGTGTES